jgi:hypothetical protein
MKVRLTEGGVRLMRSRVPAVIAAVCLSGSESAALADDQNLMMDVVCSSTADVAEVRIGWEDDCYVKGEKCLRAFSQLPQRLDGGLSRRPPQLPFRPYFQGHCILPNGTKVRVRLDEEPKQATGIGGADPSDYLTVWAGGRKLLTRSMIYAGHATDNPWVAAILIRGSTLEFCIRSDDEFEDTSMPVNCTDKPPAFRDLPVKAHP